MNKDVNTNQKIKSSLKAVLSNAGTLMVLVAICTAVIAIILNWQTVTHELGRLISVLMQICQCIVVLSDFDWNNRCCNCLYCSADFSKCKRAYKIAC